VSPDRLLEAMRDYLDFAGGPLAGLDDDSLSRFISLYRERSATLAELAEQARFFFERPTEWGPEKAIRKHLLGDGLETLGASRKVLEALESWDESSIELALTRLAEERCEGRMGKLAQPLRIAVSGGPVSPPIFTVLEILEKDECLERIDACLAAHPVS